MAENHCDRCGRPIKFRYVNGVCTPLHPEDDVPARELKFASIASGRRRNVACPHAVHGAAAMSISFATTGDPFGLMNWVGPGQYMLALIVTSNS